MTYCPLECATTFTKSTVLSVSLLAQGKEALLLLLSGAAKYSSLGFEMEDTPKAEDQLPEGPSESASQKIPETLDETLSRHRKEISQLQGKEIAMKKAAAKGSKAEQKAKKKQVDEEVFKLSAKLKERHAAELSSLGYSDGSNNDNGKAKGNLDTLVKAIAGISVSSQTDHSKPSKGVKRREKRAQQEAAREQRIQEEQRNIISDRVIENEKLERKLEPLGLTVNEIKPDGHCLYRAVENQLAVHSGGSSPYTYLELRQMVAAYMRQHATDFLPFFLSENVEGRESDDSLVGRFENYCREVDSTAAWGGQLELGALTHILKKHIMIFSGSFPDVEMGKEYKSASGSGSSASTIMLSYHRPLSYLVEIARCARLLLSHISSLHIQDVEYQEIVCGFLFSNLLNCGTYAFYLLTSRPCELVNVEAMEIMKEEVRGGVPDSTDG